MAMLPTYKPGMGDSREELEFDVGIEYLVRVNRHVRTSLRRTEGF